MRRADRQIENRVRSFARREGLWNPGSKILLAVSGGADSLCMLHLLARLASMDHLELTVAHLHHGMRGAEADADLEFVASEASRLGLPFVAGHADVPGLAESQRIGLEEAGRVARREFLNTAMADRQITTAATAHTLSDHSETVLLNLFRGAGLRGLAGIQPHGFGGRVRPLLCLERSETESYCALLGLIPRRDPANDELEFARNRVRKLVLPLVRQEINPSVDQALLRLSRIAKSAEDLVHAEGRELYQSAGVDGPSLLRRSVLRAAPPAAAAAAVRLALETIRDSPVGTTSLDVERVLDLLIVGGRAPLLGGLRAEVSGDYVRISLPVDASGGTSDEVEPPLEMALPTQGSVLLPGGHCITTRLAAPNELDSGGRPGELEPGERSGEWVALRVQVPMKVRSPKRGDRLRPRGRGGSRKLSDLFNETRVPVWDRKNWPVLVDQQGIVWVPGVAETERMVVQDGALQTVWVRWEKG